MSDARVRDLEAALDAQRRVFPFGGDGSVLRGTLCPWPGSQVDPLPPHWRWRSDLAGLNGFPLWVECENGWAPFAWAFAPLVDVRTR